MCVYVCVCICNCTEDESDDGRSSASEQLMLGDEWEEDNVLLLQAQCLQHSNAKMRASERKNKIHLKASVPLVKTKKSCINFPSPTEDAAVLSASKGLSGTL